MLSNKKKKKIDEKYQPDLSNPWNRMVMDDNLAEPYKALLKYAEEINGEGHHCFIDNVLSNNQDEFVSILANLKGLISAEHYAIVFDAYLAVKNDDAKVTEITDKADEYFYLHEKDIDKILADYCQESYR